LIELPSRPIAQRPRILILEYLIPTAGK